MSAIAVDYRKIIRIVVPLAAAVLAVSAAGRMSAQAQSNHMLVIPASDGYGFDDCIGSNKACGQVIADAWCEAHGMSASVSISRSEDITASLAPAAATGQTKMADAITRAAPGSLVVNCAE